MSRDHGMCRLAGRLLWALALTTAAAAHGDGGSGDWPLHGNDAGGQRHARLDQINRDNVAQLEPAWTWRSGVKATFQATPIVVGDRMYLSLPFSHVAALDARSGRELWRYEHPRPAGRLCCGPANRGVAVRDGRVFVGTVDARLIALDARTGQPLWNVAVADAAPATEQAGQLPESDPLSRRETQGSTGVGIAMAPQVAGDLVIVGITGVGYGLHPENAVVGLPGQYGRPGVLAAFDAASGRRVWQFDVTGPGWEGSFAARTADGLDLGRDLPAERAALAREGGAWRHGGGSLWATPAIDAERGLIFFGTGNPSPQMADGSRPGDNLYTASLVALDLRTGRLVWHYQQVPHDRWGYDVASPPVLFELQQGGERIPALAQPSKLGWVYVHDRRDGRLLFRSEAFVPQQNLFAAPSAEGVVIAPGIAGGASWSPSALDPQQALLFVPGIHLPTRYTVREAERADGSRFQYVVSEPEGPRGGVLAAVDLAREGRLRWQVKLDQPMVGGVLSTAGGLLFTGIGERSFAAFDSGSGMRLWSWQVDAGVNAPPVSYAIDGRQYVAVAAGGNALFGFPQGDGLHVFALPAPAVAATTGAR
ncbi:pyrroloquinoline quinone-dependent dehydrogenase [Methyloversatilis sp. NSM2]|uniref:pyrroloquinoline quinone-dependent dehydrogenase n=1 Tax=Methyloversatilis sp. NSM2 TaxID=3134135 RepID=UPI00310E4EED